MAPNAVGPQIDEELDEQPPSGGHHDPVPLIKLELRNVTYSPLTKTTNTSRSRTQTENNRTTVLHDVSTSICPFQVSAWMGPSGSGKTSLLTVAAGLLPEHEQQSKNNNRDTALSPESRILVNGERVGINGSRPIPKRLVGVVWQDDLLLSNLTVFENVFYAARLKTAESVSDDQVRHLVMETLQDLDLARVRDSVVGNPLLSAAQRGISGGERKRVAVASELVLRPSLLFLDEPTSGLDATTALALMQTLKALATTQGHSIVAVIHQPRTTIFNSCIDSLLLLSRGRVIYNGAPKGVRGYLESLTKETIVDKSESDEYTGNDGPKQPVVTPLPPETGIADWIMDTIKADEQNVQKQQPPNRKEGNVVLSLGDYWQRYLAKSDNAANKFSYEEDEGKDTIVEPIKMRRAASDSSLLLDEWSPSKDTPQQLSTLEELSALPKFNTSFAMQFNLLTHRTLKQQRGERLTAMALVLQVTYIFFTALFWWRMPDNTDFIYQRNSLFFFMVISQSNSVVTTAVNVFSTERTLLKRERAKKMYRVLSYFLAKTVSDLTNNVLLPVFYTMVVYWMANLRPSVTAFCKFSLTYYLIFSTAQSMGLAISIAIPRIQLALVLAPPVTLFFSIMGGFYIPLDNMHPGIAWATWLSFCRYGYAALLINEYAGRTIPCSDEYDEQGNTSSVSELVAARTGSVDSCPVAGEDVLEAMGIRGTAVENFWFNIGMLIILQMSFRGVSYWLLRKSKN